MNPMISIALFPTRSSAGIELQNAFCALVQNQFNLHVEVYSNASQRDFILAMLNFDLLVMDATIEADYRDSNYPIFTENPKSMEHILVVSRTYLPINFFGFDESGAPVYPDSKTNADLLQWLKSKLEAMLPFLPRKKTLITNLVVQREECYQACQELTEKALEQKRKTMRERGQIFISYRNKYKDQVMELKKRIEAGEYHQGVKKSVIVIPAGSLVWENEILVSQRRWGIVSMTDRKIIEAEEMWVYYTPDYFESWWTQGELVTLHHRNQERTEKIKLRIYDPAQNCLRDDLSPAFSFHLDERRRQRLARWYSNCDDLTQGPELVKKMRRMRFWVNHLPPGWLDQYFAFASSAMEAQNLLTAISGEEEAGQIMNQYQDRDWRKEYFNDYVWSEEFWEHSLLKCIHPAPVSGKMDLDDFLFTKKPLHVKLSLKQLKKAIRKGGIPCPGCEECPDGTCRAVFKITEDKNPRYLWMPTRMGIFKSGDHGSGIHKLPVYRADYIK